MKAPSTGLPGRYILQPEIFNILQTQERGAGGEIQLTDAMIGLSKAQSFYGVDLEADGSWSKAGFLSPTSPSAWRAPIFATACAPR